MKDYPAHLEMMWQKAIAPRDENAPKVISTFAGGGGSLTGYMMAGYDDLLAVEWDDNAVETLRLNWPDLDIYHGDIAKLSVEEVLQRTGLKVGELDVLDGSPPCQGFSTAGKRIMNDPRNQLFREYVRLLRGLKPKVFIMENVSGMVKGKMKLVFVEILKELKASGYKVKACLLNAMYFHVPQSRERMIFIGVRDDLGIEPSHPKGESSSIPLCRLFPQVDKIRTYSQGYKIKWIESSKVQPTIGKDHSQKPTRWLIGGNEHRPTNEELSIVGSFPSCYFKGQNENATWNCIGNSVPPLFMEAIARHVRNEILDKIEPELIG